MNSATSCCLQQSVQPDISISQRMSFIRSLILEKPICWRVRQKNRPQQHRQSRRVALHLHHGVHVACIGETARVCIGETAKCKPQYERVQSRIFWAIGLPSCRPLRRAVEERNPGSQEVLAMPREPSGSWLTSPAGKVPPSRPGSASASPSVLKPSGR